MRHITTEVESKYIDFLKNDDTDLIDDDIPTVLTYLFSSYGKVPTRTVKDKKQDQIFEYKNNVTTFLFLDV